MTALRIGVIGTGTIAQMHIKSYSNSPNAEVVAVCDMNLDRAIAVANQFGARKAVADPAELFNDSEIDAVSVCTWNNTHAEFAIAAIEAGKHVLVEKPMSRTYAEALQVEEAVQASDRVLQIGYVRRHYNNCRVLKTFVDAGDLGEIYYAKASCIRRVGNPGGWFADKEISGGGPLIDVGVHFIDLCWYLMGSPNPVSVSANAYSKLGNRANINTLDRYTVSDFDPAKNSVEDMVNAVIRFENGASLMVDVSFSLHATKDSTALSVYGDKGGADLEPELQIATEKYDTVVNVTPQISAPSHFDEGFQNEIDHFVASCRGEEISVAPIDHGVQMMKILGAIYESAAAGKEIRLD